MSKYSKLITMKDNFIKAASESESDFMRACWMNKANAIQEEINKLTVKEAQEEVK